MIVGKITNVRGNLPFSFAVFLYKLLCTLVLVTVTFDAVLRPVVDSVQGWGRAASAERGRLTGRGGQTHRNVPLETGSEAR